MTPDIEIERRVLHGLAAQWEAELWVLPWRLLGRLKTPGFALADGESALGAWNRERRQIALSRAFVLRHPWDAVREVLRHEMAHQVADEMLGGDATPHGPVFREACALLRIDPRASVEHVPLDEWLRREAGDENDRLLARVNKLLALAQSANRHEAEAAMAKAHEHIARYNLDVLAAERQRQYHSVCVGAPALRHTPADYRLAQLLREFYFVRTIWIGAYVVDRGRMGRVLELSGTAENLKIAGYVHDFVRGYVDAQWSRYPGAARRSRRRRNDFAWGIVEGFRHTLARQEAGAAQGAESRALVRVSDPGLDAYYDFRYPRTRGLGGGRAGVDRGAFNAGKEAGLRMVLAKGIEGTAGRRGLLLSE